MRSNGDFNFPLGLIKYIVIIETSHYVKHLWGHLQRYVLPIGDQLRVIFTTFTCLSSRILKTGYALKCVLSCARVCLECIMYVIRG